MAIVCVSKVVMSESAKTRYNTRKSPNEQDDNGLRQYGEAHGM